LLFDFVCKRYRKKKILRPENLKARDYLEDLGMVGKIILEGILTRWHVRV
jgi:hypothetical protein